MNTVRLVFGWLFLAGFTAAGTYYAMDEVDQRVGLGRFQLHEKFGLVKMTAAQAPINNQVPPINNQTPPPVYVPPNNQIPPNTNPPPVYVPPNNQNPPSNVTPPPYTSPNNQNPPNNVTPPPYTPPNRQNPPNTNPQPVYVPPNNNQNPPNTNPQPVYPPPNNVTPPVTQQRQRPADYTETNIRLVKLQGEAGRLKRLIATTGTPYGNGRLSGIKDVDNFLGLASTALNNGDSATARRYMNEAEAEIGKLKELLDQ